jgi:hypothetical protein
MSSGLGSYAEPAMWVVVALLAGPRTAVGLLDAMSRLDGRIGPGRLLGAVARLERLGIIEAANASTGLRSYRLDRRVLSDEPATSTIATSTEEPTP